MKRVYLPGLFALITAIVGLSAYAAYLFAPRHTHTTFATVRRSVEPIALHTTGAPEPGLLDARSEKGYALSIRERMFSAPDPTRPAPKPAPAAVPPPRSIVPPIPPADPLSDAVYAGSITVNGVTSALIESRSSRQGDYVTQGGQWHEFQVESITPGQITFEVNGAPRSIVVSDSLNLVPLSANAPGADQNGQQSGVSQGIALIPGSVGGTVDWASKSGAFQLYNNSLSFSTVQELGGAQLLEMKAADNRASLGLKR